jgi:CCR4-NOT transcriptional complex subunit CAF120
MGRVGAMSPPPGPGPALSTYGGNSMGPLGMGMGPGPVMSPPRNNSFGPGVPPQQRPQMMPQQLSYGAPSPGVYGQQGAWAGPPQQRGPPPQGLPPVGMAMRGGSRPQSPAMAMPPQGQFSPVGAGPGGPGAAPRPGTPGRVPFQGQAF